jgi:hypothetical protein
MLHIDDWISQVLLPVDKYRSDVRAYERTISGNNNNSNNNNKLTRIGEIQQEETHSTLTFLRAAQLENNRDVGRDD